MNAAVACAPPVAPPWSLLRSGQRVRSFNLIPVGTVDNYWAGFWGAGSPSQWFWSSGPSMTIKAQIDQAQGLGFNAVRIPGGCSMIVSPTSGRASTTSAHPLTRAIFLANVTTMLDYCRSIGMGVLMGAGDQESFQIAASWSDYAWQQEVVALCNVLVNYQDVVISLDLINECVDYGNGASPLATINGNAWVANVNTGHGWTGSAATDARVNVNAAIHAIPGWRIPLTYSGTTDTRTHWVNGCVAAGQAIAPYVDNLWEHHFYFPALSRDLIDVWYAAFPESRFLVGELGAYPAADTDLTNFTAMMAAIPLVTAWKVAGVNLFCAPLGNPWSFYAAMQQLPY